MENLENEDLQACAAQQDRALDEATDAAASAAQAQAHEDMADNDAAQSGATSETAAASDEEATEQGAQQSAYIAELQAEVAAKDQRLNATLRQYKEALDEFESTKARLRRDIKKEIEAGKKAVLTDLLEVVDNLERAVTAGPAGDKADLISGVTMVRDAFLRKLSALGVRRIEAMGQTFDPTRFEAVSTVPVADAAQDGRVIAVVRDCYVMADETLRYGMVAVGRADAALAKEPE